MPSRRALLHSVAVGLGLWAAPGPLWSQPVEHAAYVGVETDHRGLSRASFFDANGTRVAALPLDFRAHGLAQSGAQLAVFPRRPGNCFSVVNLDTLELIRRVEAPAGRHFYGHGAFSLDGGHLLVSENHLESLRGRIAVYEAQTYQRVGELELPGAGPHELVRQPGQDRFFIALGGLETHPAYGRTALNLDRFRSELLVLDFARGGIERLGFWPGSEGVSLRHLAFDGLGRLYVGGQVPGQRGAQEAAVLWLVDAESEQVLPWGRDLGAYVSSVAAQGGRALVSSKQTGLVLELDGVDLVETRRVEGASALGFVSGLAAVSGYRLLSLGGAEISVSKGHEFDNHGLGLL